jgi:hypothetical protein
MLNSISSVGTSVAQMGGTNISQVQNNVTNINTNINVQFGNQPLQNCSCGIISASNSDDLKKLFELLAMMLQMAMMKKFMEAFQQMSEMLCSQGYDKGGSSSSSEIYVMGSKDSCQAIIGVPEGSSYMGHQGPQMLQTDGTSISPCDMSGMQGATGTASVTGAAGVASGGMGGVSNVGGSSA